MDCIDCVNQKYCKNSKNLGEAMRGCASGIPEQHPRFVGAELAYRFARTAMELDLNLDEYVAEVQKEMQKILSGELNNGNR